MFRYLNVMIAYVGHIEVLLETADWFSVAIRGLVLQKVTN